MNHQQLLDEFNKAMRMLDEGREEIRRDFQIECGDLGHVFASHPFSERACLICGLHDPASTEANEFLSDC